MHTQPAHTAREAMRTMWKFRFCKQIEIKAKHTKKREGEKQEATQNGIDSIVLNRSKCIQMCNKSLNLSQNVIFSTESLASLVIDK